MSYGNNSYPRDWVSQWLVVQKAADEKVMSGQFSFTSQPTGMSLIYDDSTVIPLQSGTYSYQRTGNHVSVNVTIPFTLSIATRAPPGTVIALYLNMDLPALGLPAPDTFTASSNCVGGGNFGTQDGYGYFMTSAAVPGSQNVVSTLQYLNGDTSPGGLSVSFSYRVSA